MFFSTCSVEVLSSDAKFCYSCGRELDVQASADELITEMFHHGYQYDVIVALLEKKGHKMHLRTLKRRRSDLGLRRKGHDVNESEIELLIRREVEGAGRLDGYRNIWHALRLRHHVHVPRSLVARLLKKIDPDGVEDRRARRLRRRQYLSPGPNFCWHVDGFDKLKTYGIPIHGCICGYSRKILWLEVVKSNNDPSVPAKLYLDTVQSLKGCPKIVRSDCGTENVTLAAMQCSLRALHTDEFAAEKAHRFGTSPANQRIEGWWSFLQRNRSSWWISFFKDMSESGVLNLGDTFHMECLWFCFMKVIQADLDKVKDHWNSHYIRKSRHDTVPGVPDILFYLPEYSGSRNCLQHVTQAQIDELEEHCHFPDEVDIYTEYFETVFESENKQHPNNEKEAFDLFQFFIQLQEL